MAAAGRLLRRRVLGLALAAVWVTASLEAHNLGQSYLYLQIYPEKISGRFEIALADLNPALGLAGTAGEITVENLAQHLDFLEEYYREHVTISSDQRPLAIDFGEAQVLNAHGGYALLPFALGGFTQVPEVLDIDYSILFDEAPQHRGLLLIEHNWAMGVFANENQASLVFSPEARQQSLEIQSSGLWRGFVSLVGRGVELMVLGFDHAMFLVALLLPAVLQRDERGAWQPVERFAPALRIAVEIVLAFAVAHFVAFGLVALGVPQPPATLVEVAIAVSVALAAANILAPLIQERIWVFVFVAGLFHGWGFVRELAKLGIEGEKLALSGLALNVGVELGQLAIVAVLLPVFFLIRRWTVYRRVVLPVAAVGMILLSVVWVVERALGLHFQLTRRARQLLRMAG